MEEKVEEPIFEIKKWNAVALWAWGKIEHLLKFYKIKIIFIFST
jgi:hypothetical protein